MGFGLVRLASYGLVSFGGGYKLLVEVILFRFFLDGGGRLISERGIKGLGGLAGSFRRLSILLRPE